MKHAGMFLLLLPAVGLATPASAAPVRPVLSNSQEPGSVIIFPFFAKGSTLTVDTKPQPLTKIEVGVVCPPHPGGPGCPAHQTAKIHFEWVCGGDSSKICHQNNFDLFASIGTKLVFDPDGGVLVGEDNRSVPAAPCANGFLIGWVVDGRDLPIKFDGLIGDVELRGNVAASLLGITPGVTADNALATYTAIPVQADPALSSGAHIAVGPNLTLIFDGQATHYTEVTGQIQGDVRYDFGFPGTPSTTNTNRADVLVLMTLDVISNRVNPLTGVDFVFFNENELSVSASTNFVCWEAAELQSIDPNLTAQQMHSARGLYISDQATSGGNQVTLLGLNLTLENPRGENSGTRLHTYPTFNNSFGVPTNFVTNDLTPGHH